MVLHKYHYYWGKKAELKRFLKRCSPNRNSKILKRTLQNLISLWTQKVRFVGPRDPQQIPVPVSPAGNVFWL